nr:hypothetical protein BaRGS_002787 [Batillaria attramentaria]
MLSDVTGAVHTMKTQERITSILVSAVCCCWFWLSPLPELVLARQAMAVLSLMTVMAVATPTTTKVRIGRGN